MSLRSRSPLVFSSFIFYFIIPPILGHACPLPPSLRQLSEVFLVSGGGGGTSRKSVSHCGRCDLWDQGMCLHVRGGDGHRLSSQGGDASTMALNIHESCTVQGEE